MLAKFLYYISEGLLLPSDVDNINVIKNKISYSIERKVSDVITDFSITIKVEKFDQTITEKEGMPHLIDKSVFQNVDELANQLINELSWFSHSKNSIPVEILKKDGPEYIPETENEEDNLKILKWSLNETYPHKQVILSQADFSLLIDNKDKYREIFLAKSFHNEGIKYYHKFEYLKAFQNFYFVIEYYYSGGRSKIKE